LKRIIYDGDPGIDDALAILLALKSPRVKLEAVTTVGGNVTVELATQNALKIRDLVGDQNFRVAKGFERPRIMTATHFHGEDGLGNTGLPPPKGKAESMNAVELIISEIMKKQWDITLVTGGPLTNLAKVVEEEPRIKEYVREVIIMGGAIRVPGNVTPTAEFNIYTDPEAAKKVFKSKLPITLVSLDVTTKTILRPNKLAEIERANTPLTSFIGRMVKYYMKAHRSFENIDGCYLHDPLAIGIAIDKSLVNVERVYVDVETQEGAITRGMTLADLRPKSMCRPNLSYCSQICSERFIEMLVNTLRG
jgi:inosine-uridine nucleoside N-ribohydrolase